MNINKNIFLKIIALMLVCTQANLFAPRGGCIGYGSQCDRSEVTACLSNSSDCRDRDSWFCSVPCNGDQRGANAWGSAASGSGSSSGGSAGAYGIKGQAQQITAQTLAERYMAPNGETCTKAEVLEMSQIFDKIDEDLAAGRIRDEQVASIMLSLLENGVPLICAHAKKITPSKRICTPAQINEMHRVLETLDAKRDMGVITATDYHARMSDLRRGRDGDNPVCASCVEGLGCGHSSVRDTLKRFLETVKEKAATIKKEIIEKNCALPGVDECLKQSVACMTRCDQASERTPEASEILDVIFLGDRKQFADRAEQMARKCIRTNEPRHICYSMNAANGAAAKLDASSDAEKAAFWARVDKVCRDAQGGCV